MKRYVASFLIGVRRCVCGVTFDRRGQCKLMAKGKGKGGKAGGPEASGYELVRLKVAWAQNEVFLVCQMQPVQQLKCSLCFLEMQGPLLTRS